MAGVEVVGLGQCSLDMLAELPCWPQPDSKIELDDLLIQGGGPVATALVTLSRLGISTAFLGRTGDDENGKRIRQGLLEERVDCTGLLADAGATSQCAFIAVEPQNGRRTIFWTRGGARPLDAGEVARLFTHSCRMLHLDGLHTEAALTAARRARERGIGTVLDGGAWRGGTAELLPWIDHLVVSEKFAGQVASSANPHIALEKLLAFGGRAVTVTLGAGGSHTLSADGVAFHQPAFSVDVVDTTGCGDVFHGGYIYGLLQGWPLRRTVRFAAACAALKTRAMGGRTAIPHLGEIEEFLAVHPQNYEKIR
ncbi:MAG: PfkB family carbohydrate kinase [Desulfuromonadales bacterium]|jgi:ribokinase